MAELSLAEHLEMLKKSTEQSSDFGKWVETLALVIDTAGDESNENVLVAAIEISEGMENKSIQADASLVLYHRSNAWASLQHIRRTGDDVWRWEQPELVEQIFALRGAIQHPGFVELPAPRRAQIYCNLGNSLSTAGRIVDALVEWKNALVEQRNLGMARGNLGVGLARYGMQLYDEGHTYWFLRSAQNELSQAITGGLGRDGSTYPEALDAFRWHSTKVERELSCYEGPHDSGPSEYPVGKSKRERAYRTWCLGRNLFLNPLNDLGPLSIAAQDVLLLPGHRIKGAGITYRAFFNQLKQEYVYARLNLFEGTARERQHFADRELPLESNADFALYSIGVEQVKTSFRLAYSLLDKLAYFINDYWRLEIPEKQVSFRKLWVEDKKGREVPVGCVRKVFEDSKNLPLRALYWLAKDIYDQDFQEVADPIAKELDALRNHLEHKALKVVLDGLPQADRGESEMFEDHLSHLVGHDELAARAEHLLRMTRSALIYLALAMFVEEQRAYRPGDKLAPVDLGLYTEDRNF
ncbi:hypothetical protein GTP44_15485 [Duganella sp. FT50W]|uniref:LA2681-like HEPN domain-containing protein n=1 Tax=Duganella lactea TaxID=2692173 RepID=A0A6L8MM75_9BURK|nr:LA2681 family HEPN domain-containing protein [Duganella lactea]MYM83351.1 hypothetical protein [Duganella lactea]